MEGEATSANDDEEECDSEKGKVTWLTKRECKRGVEKAIRNRRVKG